MQDRKDDVAPPQDPAEAKADQEAIDQAAAQDVVEEQEAIDNSSGAVASQTPEAKQAPSHLISKIKAARGYASDGRGDEWKPSISDVLPKEVQQFSQQLMRLSPKGKAASALKSHLDALSAVGKEQETALVKGDAEGFGKASDKLKELDSKTQSIIDEAKKDPHLKAQIEKIESQLKDISGKRDKDLSTAVDNAHKQAMRADYMQKHGKPSWKKVDGGPGSDIFSGAAGGAEYKQLEPGLYESKEHDTGISVTKDKEGRLSFKPIPPPSIDRSALDVLRGRDKFVESHAAAFKFAKAAGEVDEKGIQIPLPKDPSKISMPRLLAMADKYLEAGREAGVPVDVSGLQSIIEDRISHPREVNAPPGISPFAEWAIKQARKDPDPNGTREELGALINKSTELNRMAAGQHNSEEKKMQEKGEKEFAKDAAADKTTAAKENKQDQQAAAPAQGDKILNVGDPKGLKQSSQWDVGVSRDPEQKVEQKADEWRVELDDEDDLGASGPKR